jgi:hypothetical protein
MLTRVGGETDGSPGFLRSLQWVVTLALSVPLMVACALPLFLKPKPRVWIYDLVIICLGTSSILFLPFCIPLIIFWVKPETRTWFGRD